MASILDPPIHTKVAKMRERVRWGHAAIHQRQIDPTRLVLEGEGTEETFSFLVIGDSGSGPHTDHHPQRRIAEQMLPHLADCRFLLHTGDVVYQVGSSEQYPDNFIKPYREWLVGGEHPERIAYNRMCFRFPFLAVPGNHDYYNLPRAYGLLVQLSRPLRKALRLNLRPNVGWHGSGVGDAYARAFLDYLKGVPPEQLPRHLDAHYSADTSTGRALRYRPQEFTRLPNRYYRFTSGGVDFFALDSSTFNAPSPPPTGSEAEHRQRLQSRRREVLSERLAVVKEASELEVGAPHTQERLDDLQAKLEQIDEVLLDIDKQIASTQLAAVDGEQLLWLRDGLIESWQNPAVRGRILYFHHPPYVSENTKVYQGQTLAVRHHLRWVLDQVREAAGELPPGRQPVDLVINGHAHCFEYLRTVDTGHSDSHINWLVCGGSGLSLRRQQEEGTEIYELFDVEGTSERRLVAKSQLYMGLTGHKTERRRPYSFLRIDVKPGNPPQFVVRPYISERYHQQWRDYELDPLML